MSAAVRLTRKEGDSERTPFARVRVCPGHWLQFGYTGSRIPFRQLPVSATDHIGGVSSACRSTFRAIAVGCANWLQVGGDGGLPTASVLLTVCASARRNGIDPWAYLRQVLSALVGLLPDEWAKGGNQAGRPADR
jgi:hypothetical protein